MDSSPRILFVEDDKDSSDLMEFMLHQNNEGYEITLVQTAEEALGLLANEAFDLFILDYTLPQMSGVELCRRIRETNSKTPIIFFTGMSHVRDRQAAMKAGATEYLVKPNDLDKLPITVTKLIHRE